MIFGTETVDEQMFLIGPKQHTSNANPIHTNSPSEHDKTNSSKMSICLGYWALTITGKYARNFCEIQTI